MAYVVGVMAAVFVIVLLWAVVTGRVRIGSCCAVADPAKDLRMRAAFDDDQHSVPLSRQAKASSQAEDHG